jgi:sec-independent protein translocase protein TatB
MLSIPHMIVVFIVVLVVFGPQKLPELARSLGKLMAEFRKASGDFKSAFEDEMRDLERQARISDLKKQVPEAAAAASDGAKNPTPAATLGSPAATESLPESSADNRLTEVPVVTPAAGTVPRLDADNGEMATITTDAAKPASESNAPPPHDQQQPA